MNRPEAISLRSHKNYYNCIAADGRFSHCVNSVVPSYTCKSDIFQREGDVLDPRGPFDL